MTITYSDGKTVEAVLLSRTENSLRLAVPGADDVVEFSNVRGTWASAECEPVSIEFAWQRQTPKPSVTEAECCCSPELAARLIQSLFDGSNQMGTEIESSAAPRCAAMGSQGVRY